MGKMEIEHTMNSCYLYIFDFKNISFKALTRVIYTCFRKRNVKKYFLCY